MKKIGIVLILLLHITLWFALKPVWPFSDDYWYAFHAHNFFGGSFNYNYNQFQNRFPVYVPTSILFAIFGINPYSIALWPLLASCLTIVIVWLVVKKFTNHTTALITTFLIALNPFQLTYSIALFPDIIEAFFCSTAILVLYYCRIRSKSNGIYPIIFVSALLFGFLAKETAILVVPFIVILFINDLVKRTHLNFWKNSIFIGLFALGIVFTAYYKFTGNPFFRLNGAMHVYTADELFSKSDAAYLQRTYSTSILRWFNEQLGYVFILAMGLYLFFKLRRKNTFGSLQLFIAIYVITLLIEFVCVFYSKHYGMLFSRDRIWLLMIVPFSILSAGFIFNSSKRYYIYLIAVFSFLIVFNYYTVSALRSALFFAFLVSIMLSLYLSQKNSLWKYSVLVPFAFMSIYFVYSNSNYRVGNLQTGNLVKHQLELLNSTEKKIILCDSMFVENHFIYNQFREYAMLKFFKFGQFDSLPHQNNLFVLVNTETSPVPNFILVHPDQWERQFDEGRLTIYRMKVN